MAFSFGFSGDDIDIDDSEINNEPSNVLGPDSTTSSLPELVKADKHDVNEWLSVLPSQISFNRLEIANTNLVVARREIFDIRTQLMAEDSADHDNEELIAGLEHGDLKPRFYEGGFKTWECSVDLAKLVTGDSSITNWLNDSRTDVHIIELGAGTAVPSLALFAYILGQKQSGDGTAPRRIHFTFADYNAAVLRLVTLPNLLLTWCHARSQVAAASTAETGTTQALEEELDISPQLITDFMNDTSRRGISCDFVSGAWSPEFVDLVFSNGAQGDARTLLLASETIYSPSSLTAFSETLLALMRRSSTPSTKSQALVAAKKVYFGVGGGVDEFLAVLKNVGGDALEVQRRLDVQSEGVGRVVLEVLLAE